MLVCLYERAELASLCLCVCAYAYAWANHHLQLYFSSISFCIHFFTTHSLYAFIVTGSDWPLYIGLAVVGAICVALGAGLARGARKGRRLPPYSIARTGKHKQIYNELAQ